MNKIRNVKGMVGNGERLIMARLNLKYAIISCYVPTEDAKEARE